MRGKGWRLCVNQNQDEIKLLPPSPSFKMSNQTVCKRGIIRYPNKTSYKVQNTSKCIKDLSGKFSTCTISRKSLIRRSRPLIHFFLHDNLSEFTCSQNMRAICALKVQPPNVQPLEVCFFLGKNWVTLRTDSARATFSRQISNGGKRVELGGVGGSRGVKGRWAAWGWGVQMALIYSYSSSLSSWWSYHHHSYNHRHPYDHHHRVHRFGKPRCLWSTPQQLLLLVFLSNWALILL